MAGSALDPGMTAFIVVLSVFFGVAMACVMYKGCKEAKTRSDDLEIQAQMNLPEGYAPVVHEEQEEGVMVVPAPVEHHNKREG
jgi:hypothetical protein